MSLNYFQWENVNEAITVLQFDYLLGTGIANLQTLEIAIQLKM